MSIQINKDFELAFEYVTQTKQSVFLTGKAGTGKTTFLKYLKENCKKNLVVAAPTGVAAINAGGTTLHSLFQLPFNPYLPEPRGWGQQEAFLDKNDLIAKIKFRKERLALIRNLELLIIDEISMVRCDLIDAIDVLLRSVRHKANQPFGGVQVLMIGDLFQLPPVVKEAEWSVLGNYYKSPFFFDSYVFKEIIPTYINFSTIYRQKQDSFIKLLNHIRENTISEEDLDCLNQRYNSKPTLDKAITLTTHNSTADNINVQQLQALTTKPFIYKASVKGDFNEYAYPAEASITLKVGARVMFTKNDTGEDKRYYNGKIGIVHYLSSESVVVDCNGVKIDVEQHDWKNIRYNLDKENNAITEEEVGVFSQLPLRLAWAITIHKSQGLTFEACAIDAGRSFSSGQLYVALSRCTTLEGITLLSKINRSALMVNNHVVNYIAKSQAQDVQQELKDYKTNYAEELLLDLFNYSAEKRITDKLVALTKEQIVFFTANAITEIVNWQQQVIELHDVAQKFHKEISNNIKAFGWQTDSPLQIRLQAASNYFAPKLLFITNCLNHHSIVFEHKQISVLVDELLQELYQNIEIKNHYIAIIAKQGSVQSFFDARSTLTLTYYKGKTYVASKSPVIAADSNAPNPELYRQLLTLRNELIQGTDLSTYMVANKDTLNELVAYLPTNRNELLLIKGFGEKKYRQFGEEFLSIIRDYLDDTGAPSNMHNHPKAKKPKPKAATKEKPIKEEVVKSIVTTTVQETINLFLDGFLIPQIAEKRAMVVSTIEGHLAIGIDRGVISINQVIPQETLVLILKVIAENTESTLVELYKKLNEQYSYGIIRMCLAQWRRSVEA